MRSGTQRRKYGLGVTVLLMGGMFAADRFLNPGKRPDSPQDTQSATAEARAGKRELILDVDTGRDDAWTILAALKQHEVKGIVVSYGNSSLDKLTRNTLDVLGLGQKTLRGVSEDEKTLPVWSGAAEPDTPVPVSLAEIARREGINGNGLCNIVLPENPEDAVGGIEEFAAFLREHPDTDYLVCGPLTNLARLTERFAQAHGPDFLPGHLRSVIIMGGSFDPGLAVDFNFRADPAAAQKVIRAFGEKLTLLPFDETKKLRLTLDEIKALRPRGTASAFTRELMLAHARGWSPDGTIMLHDPATLLALEKGRIFVTEKISVVQNGDDAGKVLRDPDGTAVKRLLIPEGEEKTVRDHILTQYMNFQP